MPKPTKEELSAKISQLEQELSNFPDNLFLDDEDDYAFASSSRELPDADFFDIEMEPSKKEVKFWRTSNKRGKEFKQQFFPRARASTKSRGRGRGFFKTMYRGKYVPSFVPNDSQRPQNLYNDEEDWSQYVPQTNAREELLNEEYSKSPLFEDYDNSMNSKYIVRKDKDKRKVLENKDMFYFPNESADKKKQSQNTDRPTTPVGTSSETKNKRESSIESGSNKAADVLGIFQELQSKLSSSGEDIPGFDILAETLKKLEKLKETAPSKDFVSDSKLKDGDKDLKTSVSKSCQNVVNKSDKEPSPTRKVTHSSSKTKDKTTTSRRESSPSYKRESSPLHKREDRKRESSPSRKHESSPPHKREVSPPHKRDSSPHQREDPRKRNSSPYRKRENSPPHKREASPPHKRDSSPHQREDPRKRNLSPYRKRENSPSGKRESSSYKTRSPVSPSRRRPSSPSRRRRSPSPSRRRRSPSPSYKRTYPNDSPHRRRDADSPSRKRRDSDAYSRWRRSRSRSPRKDSYRRSSSRSPRRSDYSSNYRRRRSIDSPIILSPSPERSDRRKRPLDSDWYSRKTQDYGLLMDPLQQPIPPGGESSDVYAQTKYNQPVVAPVVITPELTSALPPYPPPAEYPQSGNMPPFQSFPPHGSQFYPPFHQPTTGPGNVLPQEIPGLGPPTGPPMMTPQHMQPVASSQGPSMDYPDTQSCPPMWGEGGMYPGPSQESSKPVTPEELEEAKRKAVENEMKQQKLTLKNQRKDYLKKQALLKKDLDKLAKQKQELQAEKRGDNESVIRKTSKMQLEIQNKLKAIANVIDMLSGIIGEEEEEEEPIAPYTPEVSTTPPPRQLSDDKVISLESHPGTKAPATSNPPPPGEEGPVKVIPDWRQKAQQSPRMQNELPTTLASTRDKPLTPLRDSTFFKGADQPNSFTPSTLKTDSPVPVSEVSRETIELTPTILSQLPPELQISADVKPSTSESTEDDDSKFNVIHYDPELHWCRVCNVFPRTAKEFLNHLHAPDHKQNLADRKLVDMPWHSKQPVEVAPVHKKDAPTKRVPIKGLQFFISATAWYCKLCDTWIGDLHCASVHLKSSVHSKKFSDFTNTNPHWEVDWLTRRTRAYEQTAEDRRRLSSSTDQSQSQLGTFKTDASKPTPITDKIKLMKTASEQLMSALKDEPEKGHNKQANDSSKKRRKHRSSSSSSSSSSTSSSSSNEDKKEKSNRSAVGKKAGTNNKDQATLHSRTQNMKSKWDSPEKDVQPNTSEKTDLKDDRLLNEWMETANVASSDQKILNDLSDRMKLKQRIDKNIERLKDLEKQRALHEQRLKDRNENRRSGSSKDSRNNEKSDRNIRRNENSYRSGRRDLNSIRSDRKHESSNSKRSDVRSNKKENSNSKSNLSKHKTIEKSSNKDVKKNKPISSGKNKQNDSKSENTVVKPNDIKKTVEEKTSNEVQKTEKTSNRKGMWLPPKSIFDESEKSISDNKEEESKSEKFEPVIIKKNVKKTISINVSKTSFPFIGRMPFINKANLHKQNDETEKKNEAGKLIWPDIPLAESKEESKCVENKRENHKTDLTDTKTAIIEPKPVNTETKLVNIETKPVNTETISVKTDANPVYTAETHRVDTKTTSLDIRDTKTSFIPKSTLTLTKTPSLADRVANAKKLLSMYKAKEELLQKISKTADIKPVDMEIDDEDKPEESLPPDLQTSLQILFPTETPGSHNIEEINLPDSFESANVEHSNSFVISNAAIQPPLSTTSQTIVCELINDSVNLCPAPSVILSQQVITANDQLALNTSYGYDTSQPPPLSTHQTYVLSGQPMNVQPENSGPMCVGPIDHTPMEHQPHQAPVNGSNPIMLGPGHVQPNMDLAPIVRVDDPRGQRPVGPSLVMGSNLGGLGQMVSGPQPPMIDHGPRGSLLMDPGPRDTHIMNHGPRGPSMMDHGPRGPPMMNHGPRGPPMMDRGPRIPPMMDRGPRGPPMMDHGPRGPPMMNHGPRGIPMMDRVHWDSSHSMAPMGQRPMGPPPPPPPRFPMRTEPMRTEPMISEIESEDSIAKRKNPPSQKKRLQIKRRREEIEAKEKEMQEKIALQLEMIAKKEKEAEAKKETLNELAMLGIDEDDLAAQSY